MRLSPPAAEWRRKRWAREFRCFRLHPLSEQAQEVRRDHVKFLNFCGGAARPLAAGVICKSNYYWRTITVNWFTAQWNDFASPQTISPRLVPTPLTQPSGKNFCVAAPPCLAGCSARLPAVGEYTVFGNGGRHCAGSLSQALRAGAPHPANLRAPRRRFLPGPLAHCFRLGGQRLLSPHLLRKEGVAT